MTGARALLRERWGDGLVVLVLVAGLLEILVTPTWQEVGQEETLLDASRWVAVPFCFLWTLPLLARKRSALVAGVAAMAAFTIEAFISAAATYSVVAFITVLATSAIIGFQRTAPAPRSAG